MNTISSGVRWLLVSALLVVLLSGPVARAQTPVLSNQAAEVGTAAMAPLFQRIVVLGASVSDGFVSSEPLGGPKTPTYRFENFIQGDRDAWIHFLRQLARWIAKVLLRHRQLRGFPRGQAAVDDRTALIGTAPLRPGSDGSQASGFDVIGIHMDIDAFIVDHGVPHHRLHLLPISLA